MPKVSPIQTSFNGGEFSPRMYGRVDFDGYRRSLKTCLNMMPFTQGPLTRRPGTRFVKEVKTSSAKTRLVRFEFSTTQAYILEFGNLYFRVYKDRGIIESSPGTPVEVVTPYTTDDIFDLQFVQSNDVLYVAHPSYAPRKITRTSHTSWTVSTITFKGGPFMKENTDETNILYTTTSGELTKGSSIDLRSRLSGVFNADMVGALILIREPDAGLHSLWQATSDVSVGDFRRWAANTYKCTAAASAHTGTEPPTHTVGEMWDGASNGEARKWLYLHSGYGTVRITGYTDSQHVTVTCEDYIPGDLNGTSSSGGTYKWARGCWADDTGYPSCVTFHEDRLVWSGAPDNAQRINASVTSDYENHAPRSLQGVVADDSALSFVLNSNDVQNVTWMASDERGLAVGTVKATWIVRSSNLNEALTPTNVNAKPIRNVGCPSGLAIRADKAVMFVQGDAQRKVREFLYSIEEDSFRVNDMTKLADHVSRGGIVALAYQEELTPIVWAARTDGVLLGLTYAREDNVVGWHRHELGGDGAVESVATIPAPDGLGEDLWMVVKRTIGGGTKRYVEYLTKPWDQDDDPLRTTHFDCSLEYDGTPVTSVSGLDHLEGETVSVMVDGASHPDKVVSSGAITLDVSASVVQVGYSYDSDGEMLRVDAGAADGTAQGKSQRYHRVVFRLLDAGGMSTGPRFDKLTEVVFRTQDDIPDEAVPLFSGDQEEQGWDGDSTSDEHICWRFSGPFPGTVCAVMPQLMTQDR